jgi:NAD-reducing hydrogenase large subunit
MANTIRIEPVTRIEGHAKVTIHLDPSGEVDHAQFHVAEFRGFESFCAGRPFAEMPGIMARICGICPISHILSSAKACDALLAVDPPPGAVAQRRLLNSAQILQSHALSFFHLSSPDLLLGFDAPPAGRNLFGVFESDPDFARRGVRLRQFGQQVIEIVTGKRVHPNWGVPGGVMQAVTAGMCDQMRAWIPEAMESLEIALGRLKHLIDAHPAEVQSFGTFPSMFMGSVSSTGELDFYDGRVRITDSAGAIVADQLDPAAYADYIGEASEDSSYMKFPYYKPLGYPAGMYRVGPLARLNVASSMGTPRADAELREFKHRGRGAVIESFHYHLARVIEMIGAVERIGRILDDPDLLSSDLKTRALLNRRQGAGSCEAPRGILFHDYRVDRDGRVEAVNLLIATAQNNLALQQAVTQAARRFVHPQKLEEGMLNRVEAAVRCYDPCLSCSTHALGQMPLAIELRGPEGELRGRIAR